MLFRFLFFGDSQIRCSLKNIINWWEFIIAKVVLQCDERCLRGRMCAKYFFTHRSLRCFESWCHKDDDNDAKCGFSFSYPPSVASTCHHWEMRRARKKWRWWNLSRKKHVKRFSVKWSSTKLSPISCVEPKWLTKRYDAKSVEHQNTDSFCILFLTQFMSLCDRLTTAAISDNPKQITFLHKVFIFIIFKEHQQEASWRLLHSTPLLSESCTSKIIKVE